MSELDTLYRKLLHLGFIVLRQAVESGNSDWLNVELEMLHNVPSLIGEENPHRHQYYWTSERVAYIDWITHSGQAEAISRMRTYYEPIWNEMESLVADLVADPVEAT